MKIKQLDFKSASVIGDDFWCAFTPFDGKYIIYKSIAHSNKKRHFCWALQGRTKEHRVKTYEEAVKAANEHFAATVKECIEDYCCENIT